jgi:hypothetical protein
MKNNSVKSTQVKSLPYLPELSGIKTTRVVTKHFTNLAMYMNQQLFSLLSWLIYQSKPDNTIIYSTQLLIKFKESIFSAHKIYTPDKPFKADIKVIRGVFSNLIGIGYLLPNYDKKVFTINPMLSYHPGYLSASNYKSICAEYQDLYDKSKHWIETASFDFKVIQSFTKRYSETINSAI